MQVEGGVFVVTGGASGLGAGTARMLVENGGRVVLADVQRDAGEALAKELGVAVRFVETDVTSEESAQAAINAAVSTFGGLHGLVNCAGVAPAEKVLGKEGAIHRLATFQRVINVNLVGSFNMIRLAADAMSKGEPNAAGERGVIVSTASVAAFDGQIGQSAYAASKGGVVAMTLPIARELARSGIRVMTIAPGIFETPMLLGMPVGSAGCAGQDGAVPVAPGHAGGVRGAGAAYHRKRDAERRGDPPGWRHPHGAQVTYNSVLRKARGSCLAPFSFRGLWMAMGCNCYHCGQTSPGRYGYLAVGR